MEEDESADTNYGANTKLKVVGIVIQPIFFNIFQKIVYDTKDDTSLILRSCDLTRGRNFEIRGFV